MAGSPACPYNLVLTGGRVLDPQSGLDAERDVAVRDGRIVRITAPGALARASIQQSLDCRGKVVCPGFIDTHSHAAGHAVTGRLQAVDGVTTHLELEFGHHPVEDWYDAMAKAGDAVINYGCSAGHIMARMAALDGDQSPVCQPHLSPSCACCSAPSHLVRAYGVDVARVVGNLEASLDQGGIGIGMGIAYTEQADHEEVYRVFEMAGKRGVCVYVHNRGEMAQLSDMHELFADAAATGASLQICHIASSCGQNVSLPLTLEMMDRLNERGAADVSCEMYPYTAGMTNLKSGVFKVGWQERLGISYNDVEWLATGTRLRDEADFTEKRSGGGLVCIHSIPAENVDRCFAHPRCMVASDCIPYDEEGRGHPRGAGTFCKTLRVYVRERRALTLSEAVSKMTIMPAKRLESFCPALLSKGRVQEGCDADLCVFDPAVVADTATFANPASPSVGMSLVIVGGSVIVRDGVFVEGVPARGRPVRGEIRPRGAKRKAT